MLRKVKREAGQDGITSARKRAGTIFKSGGRPRRGVGAPVQFPKVAAGVAGAISGLGRPCRRDFLKCPFLPQNGTNPPHIYTFIVIYEIKCKINGNFSQNCIIYMDYLHYFALKNVKSVPFLSKI